MSKPTQAMIKESVDKAASESLSEIRIQAQIEQFKPLFINCPKCGCRNSAEALRCWWCRYQLKKK